VSDRARFCHHCGIGLTPELAAGDDTELLCPACSGDRPLTSRRLGAEQVTVLECGRCAGCWLGPEAFRLLAERARKEALAEGGPVGRARAVSGSDVPPRVQRGPLYRPCVVCGKLMNRRNYGGSSGVIVDICRDHGTWYDADELARILAWLRAGGTPRPARARPTDSLSPEIAARLRALEMEREAARSGSFLGVLGLLGGLIGWPPRE
jgi:Zn-finger nucleic acid-binding protein